MNGQLNGFIGADLNTLTTAAAAIADLRVMINELDSVNKADSLCAISAAQTILVHLNAHTWQAVHLGADLGRDLREHFHKQQHGQQLQMVINFSPGPAPNQSASNLLRPTMCTRPASRQRS
ncbi:MAG: hypothetical protein WBD62_20140, partial [Anaerolineales bacterium]